MLPNQNQVLRCVCFRSYIVIISIARPAKSFQNFSLSDIYSFFSTHQHHPSRTQKSPWSTSIREFLLLLIFFFFHSKINPVGITLTHPTFIFTEPYNLKLSSHSKLPSTTTTPHKKSSQHTRNHHNASQLESPRRLRASPRRHGRSPRHEGKLPLLPLLLLLLHTIPHILPSLSLSLSLPQPLH